MTARKAKAPASAPPAGPAVPLYPFQQRWLLDPARFKIGMFSRQTGKTFTSTLALVDDCFGAWAAGQRRRWVILSRGERQAKEAMDEGVKRHAKAYQMALEVEVEYDFKGETGASYKALEVTLPGGSRITALPANPDTARGFSASVLLDEFAFHHDSRAIWKALFPVVSAGHRLLVVSTPNGKGNKFYELMTGDDPVWSRHTVDIYQAVAEGLPRNIDELRAGIADEDAWSQEYELKWLDEASAWLPYGLIFACEDPAAGDPAGYQGGPVYIGNDIAAGGGDLWVAWVWEQVGDVLWCREIVELRRASFAEQDATMDELFGRYRVVRLAMDQTGMGEKPVEDAKRRYGDSRVEGIHFTGPAKLSIAGLGKARFEDRKVRIPEGRPALRADLHSLVKLVGPTGQVRFVAPREGGSHADRTWAAFLGLAAAEGGATETPTSPCARPARAGRRGTVRATTTATTTRPAAAAGPTREGMVMAPRLLDQYGNPIERAVLRQEVAGPTLTGVRQPISGHPAAGLTPARLAAALREADAGDIWRYLELAEDMEEHDLHYAGVLATRKRSVSQLPITVEAAADDAESVRHADLIRSWLTRLELQEELFHILDAVGKGFSFCEIVWDTSEGQWLPERLEWRDPRWFGWELSDLRTPRLRAEDGTLEPLPAYKFIYHVHPAKSGLPLRSGLARIASWAWMFKSFTSKDWQIFIQVYGQPLRVGRYGPEATDRDKDVLFTALMNVAADCAAMIPKGMEIEFVRADGVTNDVKIYQERCNWLDQQVSKAVLGQTATTDAIAGEHAVGQEHRQVQEDIERADARLLAATLLRDLIKPIVALNFGPQKRYPTLRIGRGDEIDLALVIDALDKLVPKGLKVQMSEVRDRLGFADPDDGAELLTAPAPATVPAAPAPAGKGPPAAHAAGAAPPAGVADRLAVRLDAAAGPVLDRLIDQVRAAIAAGASLAEAAGAVQTLNPALAVQDLAEVMTQGAAVAWLAGAADVVAEDADG